MQTTENQRLIVFIETLLDSGIDVSMVARIAMDYATSDILVPSQSMQATMAETATTIQRIMEKRKPRWKQGHFGPMLPSTPYPNGLLPFRHKEEED